MRRIPPQVLIAVLLATIVGAGCQQGGGKIWVASEMVRLGPKTPPRADELLFDQPGGIIRLFAAANETVSFQLVLDAPPAGWQGLGLAWGDLTGPGRALAAENIRAFRAWPVDARPQPEEAPAPSEAVFDALRPLGAAPPPIRIGGGQRAVFWFDLTVPPDALPGRYETNLTIRSGWGPIWQGHIELEVYEFVLPASRPLVAIGGFEFGELCERLIRRDGKPFRPVALDRSVPEVRQGLALMHRLMRLAREHGLYLFEKSLHPILKRDLDGRIVLNWEDYDALLKPYLDGSAFGNGIGCPAWPMPISEDWPIPSNYGGAETPLYAETVSELLAAYHEHFRQMQAAKRRVFLWPWRGPVCQQGYRRQELLGSLARKACPGTPILCNLPLPVPAEAGWQADPALSALVDMAAPPGEFFDPAGEPSAGRLDHPLAGRWICPGSWPNAPRQDLRAEAADLRVLGWLAMKYHAAGVMIPEVLGWSKAAGSPAGLFYPGGDVESPAVWPSARLKRLRRGLQDVSYLYLLTQRGEGDLAEHFIGQVARRLGQASVGENYLDALGGGWLVEPKAWHLIARLLAEEVAAAGAPEQSRPQRLVHRLQWQQYDEQAHSVVLQEVRSRLRGQDGGEGLILEVEVALENRLGRDEDVTACFARLPEGWEGLEAQGLLAPLATGERGTIALSARGPVLPIGAFGKVVFGLNLATDFQPPREIPAVAALLRPPGTIRAPAVDGDLEDWTGLGAAVAGGFTVVDDAAGPRPRLAEIQSQARVVHDRRNLYLAIRCDLPAGAEPSARSDNVVRYRRLLPTGEDLVEIIFDPGQSAKAAEDLYRLIVKSNGVVITRRGVDTDPPLGRSWAWLAAAKAAVRQTEGAWTVELAVPRAAFGSAGRETFWGVNFVRLIGRTGQVSSWAPARRHCYDPRNLGTMILSQ